MLGLRNVLLPSALLAAITFAFSPAAHAPNATASTTEEVAVSMYLDRFVPEDIVVAAGTTVIWINDDYDSGEYHNVLADNGAFASDNIGPGGTFSHSFSTPGTYIYYCDLHEGMFGTVTVN